MGYSVYLTINTGIEDVDVVDVGDYTYNVGDMFQKALGFRLGELDGRVAEGVIETLNTAIKDMKVSSEEYKVMNPENGWGSYEGALGYLMDIRHQCEKHPKCTIRVC